MVKLYLTGNSNMCLIRISVTVSIYGGLGK